MTLSAVFGSTDTADSVSLTGNFSAVENCESAGGFSSAEKLISASANFSARSLVGSIFANDGAKASHAAAGEVVDVASTGELQKVIADNPNKTVVVFFSLPSCKPCEEAYPSFVKQAQTLGMTEDDVVFVYCSNSDVPFDVMNWESSKSVAFPFVAGFKNGGHEIFFNREDIGLEIESFGLPLEAKIANYENKLNSNLPEVKIKGVEALAMLYLGSVSGEMPERVSGADFARAVFSARGMALNGDAKIAARVMDVYPILLQAIGADGVEREMAVVFEEVLHGGAVQKSAGLELLAKIVKAMPKSPDENFIEKTILYAASDNPLIRKNAAQVLGALLTKLDLPQKYLPKIRDALTALLKDPNDEVVSISAKQLKFFGAASPYAGEIAEELLPLLDSESDLTKAGAIESLGVYFAALDEDDRADVVAGVVRSAMSGSEVLRGAAAKFVKISAGELSSSDVQKILPVIVAKLKYDGPNFEENAQIRYATVEALMAILPKFDAQQKRSLRGVVSDVVQRDNYRWSRELAAKILEKIQ